MDETKWVMRISPSIKTIRILVAEFYISKFSGQMMFSTIVSKETLQNFASLRMNFLCLKLLLNRYVVISNPIFHVIDE